MVTVFVSLLSQMSLVSQAIQSVFFLLKYYLFISIVYDLNGRIHMLTIKNTAGNILLRVCVLQDLIEGEISLFCRIMNVFFKLQNFFTSHAKISIGF